MLFSIYSRFLFIMHYYDGDYDFCYNKINNNNNNNKLNNKQGKNKVKV